MEELTQNHRSVSPVPRGLHVLSREKGNVNRASLAECEESLWR